MVFNYVLDLRSQLATYLEGKLGAPVEQIILITTMVAAIPFSLLNHFIYNRTLRLLYSLIIGLFLHFSIYGINSFHTVFGTIASYYFAYFFGRKISPFYLLVASLTHLSILNIRRMIIKFGGWDIDDITTFFMIAVAKFSSFAFSYSDGGKDINTIISPHQKQSRIENMPSLLEYSSYIFFYPTSIVGPFIEYMDFIHFIDKKDCYANLTSHLLYIFTEGLQKLFIAIFFIVFFVFVGDKYPLSVVGTTEFREKYPKWWMRFLYMYISAPVGRSKYYIAWALTYSSLIFSGMAYGETTIKDKVFPNVEKGSYGKILYNEFGLIPRLKLVYWNMSIHIWLKYNVYTRVLGSSGIFKGNKVMASFITFFVSALWHGFYSTYFISFFLLYLFVQDGLFLEELGFYKYVENHLFMWPIAFLKTTFFYDIIGSIFFCLEISTTKQILINYYGLPVNAIVGFYIFSIIYKTVFRSKKKKIDKSKEINKKIE